MAGLVSFKGKHSHSLQTILKPQNVSNPYKHYFDKYLVFMKKFPSQNYKAESQKY